MDTSKNFIEDCVLQWGFPVSKVNQAFLEAKKESEFFYKSNDSSFIKEIMGTLLDKGNKNFVDRFIESKEYSIKKFIESLMDEDILSTDFSSSERPEYSGGHKVTTIGIDDIVSDKEQEKNNKEANI